MAILASSRTALLSDKIRGVISRPSHRSCFKSCPSVPGGFTCHCSLSFFKISQYQHREERMELEPKRDVTNPPYRHIARAPASGQDLINLLDITAVCLGVCVCLRLEDLMTHKTPLGCSGWNTVMILHLQLTGRPFSQDSGASAKERQNETITTSNNRQYLVMNVQRWQKPFPQRVLQSLYYSIWTAVSTIGWKLRVMNF